MIIFCNSLFLAIPLLYFPKKTTNTKGEIEFLWITVLVTQIKKFSLESIHSRIYSFRQISSAQVVVYYSYTTQQNIFVREIAYRYEKIVENDVLEKNLQLYLQLTTAFIFCDRLSKNIIITRRH